VRPPLVLIVFSLTSVYGQVQQQSLIDRLLRPNMDLQNSAQGKTFDLNAYAATRSSAVREFVVKPARKEKSFTGARSLAVQEYRSRSFQNDLRSRGSFQSRTANLAGQLPTPATVGIREARDANLKISGRNFPGDRAFPYRGKSQKSFNRQNPPLTIDQVRELLNKNK